MAPSCCHRDGLLAYSSSTAHRSPQPQTPTAVPRSPPFAHTRERSPFGSMNRYRNAVSAWGDPVSFFLCVRLALAHIDLLFGLDSLWSSVLLNARYFLQSSSPGGSGDDVNERGEISEMPSLNSSVNVRAPAHFPVFRIHKSSQLVSVREAG
jgi:hypothetical protein